MKGRIDLLTTPKQVNWLDLDILRALYLFSLAQVSSSVSPTSVYFFLVRLEIEG